MIIDTKPKFTPEQPSKEVILDKSLSENLLLEVESQISWLESLLQPNERDVKVPSQQIADIAPLLPQDPKFLDIQFIKV